MYLGLDCSTQSFSALILDERDGNIEHEASVHFERDLPHYHTTSGFVHGDQPGEVFSDPMMWAEALDLLLTRLVDTGIDLSKIKAISGSGQQHATVYLNEKFPRALAALDPSSDLKSQLAPCLSRPRSPIWMDSSTTEECQQIAHAVGGDEEICRRTGSVAERRFSGPQIKRFAKLYPDAWNATQTVHLNSSFFASIFAGKPVSIDYGDGAGMNLMNLHTSQWDEEMLSATAPGLQHKLPPLAPSATVAGNIAPYFSKKYGFTSDTEVLLWSGDNPNSLVGMGAATSGKMVISLGTSYTLFAAMNQPTTDPNGFGHVFGNPLGGFMTLICFQEGSLACEKLKKDLNLTWGEFDARAISDKPSPVRELLDRLFSTMLKKSAWMNLRPDTILVTGGGSQSDGIRQTISRIFNAPVQQIQTTSSAALGAAIRASKTEHTNIS